MKVLIEILGWTAFALNLFGNELLARKRISGWPVRLIANAGWLFYSFGVFAWPLFVNHVVFSVSNARGWLEWRRTEPVKASPATCACGCPGCVANRGGT